MEFFAEPGRCKVIRMAVPYLVDVAFARPRKMGMAP